MQLQKRWLAIATSIFGIALSSNTWAQTSTAGSNTSPGSRTIITAVPFLTITPDARAGAMGDVGAATSPDANSAYWNPGKLAFNTKEMGVAASYTPWLQNVGVNDIFITHLAGYYKLHKEDAIGLNFTYFNLGSIQFTDAQGNAIQDFRPNEFQFSGTYSRQLSENFSLGGSAKFIYSNLTGNFSNNTGVAAQPANVLAVDIGAYYTKEIAVGGNPSTISLGGTVQNFGPKISYGNNGQTDFIPTNLKLGGSFTTEIDEYNKISFNLDANKLLVPTPSGTITSGSSIGNSTPLMQGIVNSLYKAPDGAKEKFQEVTIGTGLEYWYDNLFAVRGGYFYENPTKGNRQFLTAGFGVRYQRFGLDISYLASTVVSSPLDQTLRFSLLFEFEKPKSEKEDSIKQ